MSSQSRKYSKFSLRPRKHRSSRRLLLESLESRNLLAADVLASDEPAIVAEGESRPLANLADYAQALEDLGVQFFGSDSCPVCARQKALFDGEIDHINVTNPDGSLNEIGQQNNISVFPTWDFPPSAQFPEGERRTGFLTLDQLAESSGLPLPTNIVLINTNKGTVELELRPDSAPATVANWLQYANDGDYDNTIFHRLVPNFVLQGGGFATSNELFSNTAQFVPIPTDPPVVNEFGISNTRATVAMAKLGGNPDSATSQFFFNLLDNSGNLDNQNGGFTVFAEVRDMALVDQLAQVSPFNLDGGVFASTPIDTDNSLIVIQSIQGSGEIRGVAFEDANGDGVRDSGEAALEGVTVYVDLNDNGQRDAGEWSATSDANGDYSIVADDGINVIRFERDANEFATTGNAGRHVVDLDIGGVVDLDIGQVTVGDVGAIDLATASDTGANSSDNRTNLDNSSLARTLEFDVSGALPNAIVRLFAGNEQLGQAAANASGAATIVTNGNFELDGAVTLTADQIFNAVTGTRNAAIDIVVDDVAPSITSTSPTLGKVAVDLAYDVESDGEGNDVTYSLQNAPTGATIDSSTGVISWSPTSNQIGDHTFDVVAEDEAGNETSQQLNIQVLSNEQLIVRLEVTDLQGNVITEVDAGQDFLVRAFVRDNRLSPQGVGAAFIDLIYQNQLVIPNAGINYGPNFPNMQSGDIDTLGVVNEIGAAGNTTNVGDGELLLFETQFTANIGGVETFTGDSADVFPDHDSFLLGDSNPADPDVIKIESTTLTINLSFGANGEKFGIDEDSGENNFDVLANDQPLEGSTADLIVTGSSLSAQGATIRIADDGSSIFYTPPTDFVGVDSFTYTVSDGNGTDSATVIVEVLDVNDPPTAVDDTFDFDEDAPETLLDVTQNDSVLPDVGETLTITNVSTPDNGGDVRIGGAGSFLLYTPGADQNGVETFTYTIEDSRGETAQATVTINLAPINDPPVAINDNFNIDEDGPTTIFRPLDNDTTGPDANETLTITTLDPISPDEGTISIVENGQAVEFTPAPDFNGAIFVGYIIEDGNGGQASNNMVFRVASVNDDPTAVDDTETITKNTGPFTFNVLENDSFAPDLEEKLTVNNVTGAANGTVSINADGDGIIYTPNQDFIGEETITYTIDDDRGGEATATLTITVRDFLPGSLAGAVFIDANDNGMRDFGETPVGGVTVKLYGTDSFGLTVERELVTDANGDYKFEGLAPGNYEIEQLQPKQLINGLARAGTQGGDPSSPDRLQVVLPEGIDGEANNFTERGRTIQFVRLRDIFLRPPMPQLEVFEDTSDGTQTFALGSGWDDVAGLELNGTPELAMLRVTDRFGGETTVPIPPEKIEIRTSGDQVYKRIVTSLADLGVQINNAAAQGEGERADSNATPAMVQPVEGPPEEFVLPPFVQPVEGPPVQVLVTDSEDAPLAEGESGLELSTNAAEHARVLQTSTDEVFDSWSNESDDADELYHESAGDDSDDAYADAVDLLLTGDDSGDESED